jgi:hypothetical protein
MFEWAFYMLIVYRKRIFGWAHNMPIMWETIELTEYVEKDILPIVVKNGGKGDENV